MSKKSSKPLRFKNMERANVSRLLWKWLTDQKFLSVCRFSYQSYITGLFNQCQISKPGNINRLDIFNSLFKSIFFFFTFGNEKLKRNANECSKMLCIWWFICPSHLLGCVCVRERHIHYICTVVYIFCQTYAGSLGGCLWAHSQTIELMMTSFLTLPWVQIIQCI